jgi:hypothetical protein
MNSGVQYVLNTFRSIVGGQMSLLCRFLEGLYNSLICPKDFLRIVAYILYTVICS